MFIHDLIQQERHQDILMLESPKYDKYKAIDKLAELGINRILTKGGKANAIEGKDELKAFSEYANGRISIMPGKSVTKENRDYLILFFYSFY